MFTFQEPGALRVSHAGFWISATLHTQHSSLLIAPFYLNGFIYKGLSLVLVKIKNFKKQHHLP